MLISEAYRNEQRYLHEVADPYLAYGDNSYNWGYLLVGIAKLENCRSILDYGCGKASFSTTMAFAGYQVQNYDPGVPAYSRTPQPADLVTSFDCLEHIESECLNDVLAHIRQLCKRRLFVSVSTRPAKRNLRDGRNAHLLIFPPTWWRKHFEAEGFVMRREWPSNESWIALMNA